MTVTHSTFTLERRYAASVERVFDAWANPDARKRWMAQGAEHAQNFVAGQVDQRVAFFVSNCAEKERHRAVFADHAQRVAVAHQLVDQVSHFREVGHQDFHGRVLGLG